MSPLKDCVTCRFAVMEIGPDGEMAHECHRFPPQVVVTDEGVEQTFPMVESGMWCGEWSSDRGR